MKKHWHHIIPKHAGGTDDESNLVLLTIEEHAESHRILYEEHNRWQDRIAWLSLSGIMKNEERIYEIISNSNRGNPSNFKHSEDYKKKMSDNRKGDKNPMFGKPSPIKGTKRPGIGGRKTGTAWSTEERKIHEEIRSKPGYYEYTKDPVRNKKISDSKLGSVGPAKGKSWYTNGINETYALICPAGFSKGRKPNRISNKKGLCWFNDGLTNRQFIVGQELEGFIRGRINKKS